MRTIKLVVAYDGSAYHGFQKQKNVQTVQNVLEEALTMLCGEKVVTAGSGRTDTGVHALAQTVTFTTNGRIPCANLVRAAVAGGYRGCERRGDAGRLSRTLQRTVEDVSLQAACQ